MKNSKHRIINNLKTLQNRKRVQAIYQNVALTLCIGLFILAAIHLSGRLIPLPVSITYITLLVLLVSVLFGICLGFMHRITFSNIATYLDNHLKLKARIITALELIQTNRQDEIAQLQINDTANNFTNIEYSKVLPHTIPIFLKWFPIPLLLIGLSFAVPRQYTLPLPPTMAENEAIDNTIKTLSNELQNVKNTNLREKIKKAIEKLENVKDVTTAHESLQTLNNDVRKKQANFPNESTIAQATETTHHFKDMDTSTLANELERLSEQNELTPELRAEIQKLFKKIAENTPQGDLSQTLDKIKGKTVSPETLKEIVNNLKELEQLKRLEAQITEGRKNIALASIETDQSNTSIANNDSAPGQETGNQETQGTQVNANNSEISPQGDDTSPSTVDNNTEKPLTGDATPQLQDSSEKFRINSEIASDTQSIARVYTGNSENTGDEPDYLPFNDVVLKAQREYAHAIENKRIPLQYSSQIRTYLKSLANLNEK